MQRSKRYREAEKKVERDRQYPLDEAISTLSECPPAKFDETVELALLLGIDPKQSDQMIRGSFSFPRGLGKESRVIVFATPEKAEAAREAGAIEAGADDLIGKIQEGWMDFDVAISTPEMMAKVGRLGRVLGPQGKMPSPKAGTVTDDVVSAVKEFRAGKIEYRNDAGGNLQVPVGKRSFPKEALEENAKAFLTFVSGLRPASVKGQFIRKAVLSTTMGPGVQLTVAKD